MIKIMAACIASFLITAIVGRKLIPVLRRMKAGQSIYEDGPKWHMTKQGTPTMGGLMFITGIAVSVLLLGWEGLLAGDLRHIYVLFFALLFALIGYLDDYQKVKKKQNLGLTASQKFLLQLVAAVAFLCLLRYDGVLTPNLYIPFFNQSIILSWPLYLAFASFVVVGTVNAVNLTDGVDGLAASVTLPVAVFFTLIALRWSGYTQLGIFAAALVGGLLGFLIYNFHPAKVFMGDTGSLFLGGIVAALGIAYDMVLIIALVGFVYLCEAMSDILQVIYFKVTHGKRIFKMAPLHHHFEMSGWSETKLVAVFTLVSTLCCILAYIGVAERFQL